MDSGPWHVSNSLKKTSISIVPKRNLRWYHDVSDIKYDNNYINKVIPPESCNCININDIPEEKIINEIKKLD